MKYIFLLFISCCFSSCNSNPLISKSVIATTSWTAAYALAAGATDVSVIAPYNMIHPSEYELRPGDIARLSKTNLIVYAGYEVMAGQIKSVLNIPEERLIQIRTNYNFGMIEESVMLIARCLGTESTAIKNLEEIRQLFVNGRIAVHNKGLDHQPVMVHFFLESFAGELGIKPSVIFGPASPEPKQILEMAKSNAVLIIDNAHDPLAGSMREILKSKDYKLLLNFPGLHETRTIADVIRYNIGQLAGE